MMLYAVCMLKSVLTPLQNPAHSSPQQPTSMIFNCMTDAMFEPANWRSFKSFVVRVRERAQQNPSLGAGWPTISMDGGPGPSKPFEREQPIYA
jgi:cytochrome c-type biogenesis protein CcmH/NrfG